MGAVVGDVIAESIGLALLIVLESLTPLERRGPPRRTSPGCWTFWHPTWCSGSSPSRASSHRSRSAVPKQDAPTYQP
jgi:hypothetical protein